MTLLAALRRVLIGLAFALAGAMPARAAVLTFDSLSPLYSPASAVPSGYGGLIWDGIASVAPSGLFSGFPFDAIPNYWGGAASVISQANVARSAAAEARVRLDPASGATGFDFIGAYWTQGFNSLALDGVAQVLTLEGWRDGVRVYDPVSFEIRTAGPLAAQFVGVNWTNIDMLRIVNPLVQLDAYEWLMDDFTYALNVPPPAVPLPGPFLLLAMGLVALQASRARRHA